MGFLVKSYNWFSILFKYTELKYYVNKECFSCFKSSMVFFSPQILMNLKINITYDNLDLSTLYDFMNISLSSFPFLAFRSFLLLHRKIMIP
jgi:hypothetical protein